MLAANPGKPVILVTHAYTYSDDTRIDRCDTNDMSAENGNNGEATWEKLVRDSSAVMVLSGHITSGGPGRRTDVANGGHLVHQMLSNYQTAPLGGEGFLRILRFLPAEERIEVTYSPWSNSYKTDADNEFTLSMAGDPTLSAGILSGRVRDSSCAAVDAATVTAAGASESVNSDASGYFTLPAPTGPQKVEVSKEEWQTESADVEVKPGYGAHLDFYLTPANACLPGTEDRSVTVCTPADGATVDSPVGVRAAAYSSKGVNFTQIYVDGKKVFQVSGGLLDTSLSMSAGTRRMTVQAKDNAGVTFKQTAYITVSEAEPPPPEPGGCTAPAADLAVNICTPADGSNVTSPVPITAKATSSAGVKLMQVWLDGAKADQTGGDSLDTSLTMTTGTRRLTVQAKDNAGHTFKQTVYVTVGSGASEPPSAECTLSTQDPSVTLCEPADSANVGSPVRIVAGTTSSVPVSYVQIYVDGAKAYHVNASSLDTAIAMSAGTHRVTVQAKDAHGRLFKETVYITVSP